ncbi:hypothetical protein D3C85_174330 [compost metagenome]
MPGADRIQVLAYSVEIGAACLEGGVHVGDLALDQLELADALTELLTVMDIGHDHIHRRLHQTQRPAAEYGAFVVEAAHQHLDAFINLAQYVLLGNLDILEHQLAGVRTTHTELVELLRAAETWCAFFQNERGHALGTGAQVGLGVDH